MSLIRGARGKRPCPKCLVPLDQLHELSRLFPARIVADAVEALRLYSVDRAKGKERLKEFGLRAIAVRTIHFSCPSHLIRDNAERLLDYCIFGSPRCAQLRLSTLPPSWYLAEAHIRRTKKDPQRPWSKLRSIS